MRDREREKERKEKYRERKMSKGEKKKHLLISAYCVFVARGEIVTT